MPITRTLLPRIGCVPATSGIAERTLRDGTDLLVFPGGDREAARPWSQRGSVTLAARSGFVRVALNTGAPVVPLVICGAHETVPIASSGARLARFLKLDKLLRVKVLPVTAQTLLLIRKIWDVLAGHSTPLTLPLYLLNTLIMFPWLPSKIVMEFLDPIDLRKETAEAARTKKGSESDSSWSRPGCRRRWTRSRRNAGRPGADRRDRDGLQYSLDGTSGT